MKMNAPMYWRIAVLINYSHKNINPGKIIPMRQIILDTETTGLSPEEGHRIIEIGCIELINRRLTGSTYHTYLQPDRDIDEAAQNVHGINNAFLADKPRFVDIVDEFLKFVRNAELIIHNAPFDIGFINAELKKLIGYSVEKIDDICLIQDTLKMARKLHPGQKNSLDALCKRYAVDNSHRTVHGALLDAEILADVYLAMTGGQTSLVLDSHAQATGASQVSVAAIADIKTASLLVIAADEEELRAHQKMLELVRKKSDKGCVWDD